MTPSPESRAAKVVADYFASDLDIINGAEGEKRTIESLIAAAIREGENAALEKAASVMADWRAQEIIRSLKHKD